MTNVDRLISLGAQAVGGDLVWKGKLLGQFRYGECILTPEGLDALNIEDVEVVEVKPRRKKAEPVESQITAAVTAPAPDADDVQIEV